LNTARQARPRHAGPMSAARFLPLPGTRRLPEKPLNFATRVPMLLLRRRRLSTPAPAD